MMKRSNAAATQPARSSNCLLADLPPPALARLRPSLKTIPVRPKQVLQYAGQPIEYVYFPNGGVFSVTTVLPDGTMVEAATVGDEGMFPIEAVFHDNAAAAGHAIMQVADCDVTRLPTEAFRREMALRGALADLVGLYAQVAVAHMMQSAACNALHSVQERCARWLLMTHDRMRREEFRLSHEFLAMMLGTRRPTVTVVAGALQEARLIAYTHGRVTVLDRKGLESAACGCYPLMRAQFDRLRRSGRSS
jgi:CRP-like cAMP-binding protein